MKLKLIKLIKQDKHLIWGTLIHAGLAWGALAFSYNSYKEYIRWSIHTVPVELKIAIQATFPLAILIFTALYLLLYGIERKGNYPTFKYYCLLIGLYLLLVNLIFFPKGRDVLIALNLSSLYLALLLLVWSGMKRLIVIDTVALAEEITPPIIYRALQKNMPRVREYFKAKPSKAFIIGFMALLIMCAFLLIFKQKEAAENLANIAYFLLVIGVGIEIYHLMKHGEKGEGED